MTAKLAVVAGCSTSVHDGDNYAQVYTTDGTDWTSEATLPLVATTNEFTCDSVALGGQRFVVGAAETFDPQDPRFGGGAFLFEQTNGQWSLAQFLSPSDVQPGDHYGWAVALAGDEVLVSAIMQNQLNAGFRGAVHVFSPRPAGSGTAVLPLVARGELTQIEGLIAFVAYNEGGS